MNKKIEYPATGFRAAEKRQLRLVVEQRVQTDSLETGIFDFAAVVRYIRITKFMPRLPPSPARRNFKTDQPKPGKTRQYIFMIEGGQRNIGNRQIHADARSIHLEIAQIDQFAKRSAPDVE